MLAKILRHDALFSGWSASYGCHTPDYITSYMLKTCLLHVNEEIPHMCINEKGDNVAKETFDVAETISWTKKIYSRMLRAAQDESLDFYPIPGQNILEPYIKNYSGWSVYAQATLKELLKCLEVQQLLLALPPP